MVESEWLQVVVVAFGAQLAVLPGEKVQFIIAGLSTRYNPAIVVGAAGTAFAGWTAVEILFGAALQGALPPAALDAVAAAFFLLFAGLLYRSAPEDGETLADGGQLADGPDVSLLGRQVPSAFGGFLPIFVMMAVGEFGDKTQLITITLATEYGAHPGIWVGEMLAILPVSIANATLSHRFSHRFDARKAHFAGAALFAFFGLDTLLALLTGFSVWEFVVGRIAAVLLAAI
jgi:putative Ca2+/H+ antiporter (TMEM165/GDT1 family)